MGMRDTGTNSWIHNKHNEIYPSWGHIKYENVLHKLTLLAVQHERKPLSNSQAQKRSESTEAALSPSSLYGTLLDGNSFNRSGYLVYDNSYQGMAMTKINHFCW